MSMTRRERVRYALNHQEPDRIPVDLGGRVTSIHVQAYQKLARHLGLNLPDPQLDPFFSVMNPHPALLEALGTDFQYLFMQGPEYRRLRTFSDDEYENEWGIRVKVVGIHSQRIGHPLEHATIGDLSTYPWPRPDDPGRVYGLRAQGRQLYEVSDYAIVAAPVSGGIFEFGQHLRGMSAFLMDLVSDPDYANRLLDILVDIQIGLWDSFLAEVGDMVEMVQLADDFGAQKSLMISPRTFRQFFKPRYARLINAIKKRTQARVFLHCDGAILKLIPDFIEMGVEVLNPLQPTADGMDPLTIKALYGNDLAFHGAIDNQQLLVKGSPAQVSQAVHQTIQALGPGGGYVLAAAHLLEPDMPVENIMAMFSAAKSYGAYPIM